MIRVKEEKAFTYDIPFAGKIKPYAHQAVQLQLVEQVLKEKKKVVIWNEAMTGAGKTLANYSYLIHDPAQKALGVYPVNELVKDQFVSIKNSLPLTEWDEVALWTAEELKKTRQAGESKIEQLKRLMSPYHRAILSNPDHLMLIAQERLYSFKKGERASLFYQLAEYTLQIFDEFHLYDIAQVNFLVQWMALLAAASPNKPYAFLLSSATPRQEFFRLTRGLELEIWNVQEKIAEWLEEGKPTVYNERTFLESLQLTLKPSLLHNWRTGEEILNDWDEVEAYLSQFPHAKGLIILDSIHDAQMLAKALREQGYEVGEVHGLSDRKHSREALAKQITVATSTVEVGVDFQGDIHKDFLLFEARNAGSFMQRLGRIGRGSRHQPDPPLYVWAYVPSYVAERLKEQAGAEITRQELQRIVSDSYQYYQDFFPYIHKVGGMNLIHSYYLLKNHHIEKEENPILDNIKQAVEVMYDEGFAEQNRRYHQWKKAKILEPVISFRGQNTLERHLFRPYEGNQAKEEPETFYPDLWFWDETSPGMPLKKYDYLFVLRRRHVRFVTKEEILERVNRHFSGAEREDYIEALKNDYVLGYAIAMGIREKPAKLYWKLPLTAGRLMGQVTRVERLFLQSTDPALNEQLSDLFQFPNKKSWIVFMVNRSVGELTDTFRLPPMFRLHSAKTREGADWSIAFNSEAFQLWSIWERVKSEVL
ncbi:type I-D CRISPR-associated helicase Cas3' [Lihuaxuella thermophila]|uniref:CRISPR-associated helicase Cas3, subtype CYANO n=1 Tax=Lihuaxuella thermophila TaxID=1173111 RepID=A0A1H8E5T0_9BACL|nr:type I-D CRISPR-associated helicase Cas3' [Lihuaxuella thermophila]SEN14941.1 CRISPR-associated helicase Cas3, subtype CYANO [Lihuaxuella thermophila]